MDSKLFAQLVLLFFVTETIGIGTGYFFVQYFAAHPEEQPTIVSENPEDISNSIALVAWILFSTAMLLIAIKFLKKRIGILLRLIEAMAIFFSSWIVLSVAILPLQLEAGDFIALAMALLLIICKNIFKQNLMIRNVATVLATAGAGAIIGTMLGIIPSLLFMVLLAVYDYIAVFKTKHMVTLAKSVTKMNLAFTYALPTKEHKFELGSGDLVVPLIFAVALLKENAKMLAYPLFLFPSAIVLIASLAGLILTIDYVSKRIGTAVPALPLQTAFMIIAFAATKIAGF